MTDLVGNIFLSFLASHPLALESNGVVIANGGVICEIDVPVVCGLTRLGIRSAVDIGDPGWEGATAVDAAGAPIGVVDVGGVPTVGRGSACSAVGSVGVDVGRSGDLGGDCEAGGEGEGMDDARGGNIDAASCVC